MRRMTTTVYAARRSHTMHPAQPTASHLAVRDGRHSRWTRDFPIRCCCPVLPKAWDMRYLGWHDRGAPQGRT